MPDTFVSNPSFLKLDATLKKLRNYWQNNFDAQQKDITVDQWLVIETLYKHKKTTHNELARNTSKDITTISRIIELLVKKGLVKREADLLDRRKVHVQLTPAGLDKYRDVKSLVYDMRKTGWKTLTEADYIELTRILDTIYANIP